MPDVKPAPWVAVYQYDWDGESTTVMLITEDNYVRITEDGEILIEEAQ